MKLNVTFELLSDFHVGTGTGIGRIVDETICRDQWGAPCIPASSLKGLARWHAGELLKLHPQIANTSVDRLGDVDEQPLIVELFGRTGNEIGGVLFQEASLQSSEYFQVPMHGRSSRDRQSGRVREGAFFQVEDAGRAKFKTELRSQRDLSHRAILLLMMALRRIERLGGQRRRGKGKVAVSVTLDECPEALGWQGMKLPDADASLVETELKRALGIDTSATSVVPVENRSPAPLPSGTSRPASDRWETRVVMAVARQPLVLLNDRETANVISSTDSISGSLLRGALAATAIERGWNPNENDFDRAFTREQLRFGPLYPVANPLTRTGIPFPTPRSVMQCKYHPGLWNPSDLLARPHGVRDILESDPLATCSAENCGAALVPVGGTMQFQQVGTDPKDTTRSLALAAVGKSSRTRTALERETQRSRDGQLFTTESVAAQTQFVGWISGPADLLDALASLWPADKPLAIVIGKSRTRGHGQVDLRLHAATPNLHIQFPGLIPHDDSSRLPKANEPFTVTFYSDTIGVDALLRPITELTGANLWRLLGGTGESPWEVTRAYTDTHRLGGFNGVPGTPRSVDVAIVAGSTCRVAWRVEANDTTQQNAIALLKQAESRGVGLRRGEGFGRVIVNFPLHQAGLNQAALKSPAFKSDAEVYAKLTFPPASTIKTFLVREPKGDA